MNFDELMALEPEAIEGSLKGKKILFYGSNTLGKTPTACRFPKPLLLMGESGGSALSVNKLPMHKKADFTKLVSTLTDTKKINEIQEKFNTIILDCVEDIIELYEVAVCKKFGVDDVSEVQQQDKGNPNGFTLYRKEFKRDINLLTSCGYTVIFIAHEETVEIPTSEMTVNKKGEKVAVTRPFIQPKGSRGDKSSSRFIRDLCDFRFYIRSNGVDESGNTIKSSAYCTETFTYYAGSRFPIVNKIDVFSAENVISAIENAMEQSAKDENTNLVDYKSDKKENMTYEENLAEIQKLFKKLEMFQNKIKEIVFNHLGEGARVSETPEHEVGKLQLIYTDLIDLAIEKGISLA